MVQAKHERKRWLSCFELLRPLAYAPTTTRESHKLTALQKPLPELTRLMISFLSICISNKLICALRLNLSFSVVVQLWHIRASMRQSGAVDIDVGGGRSWFTQSNLQNSPRFSPNLKRTFARFFEVNVDALPPANKEASVALIWVDTGHLILLCAKGSSKQAVRISSRMWWGKRTSLPSANFSM